MNSRTSKMPLMLPEPAGGVRTLPEGTIGEIWSLLVPSYESRNYGPLVWSLGKWDVSIPSRISEISRKRAKSRLEGYLDPDELSRVARKLETKREAAIRFGREKRGHGYHGERGDFCLVGGAIKVADLWLFYRSLELIGGFAFDLTLIESLRKKLNIRPWKSVTIFASRATVFALRGNSNEKLYPKLREILCGEN